MTGTLLSTALPLALWMLALAMLLCLVRILRGPHAQDRVLALDAMVLVGMLLALVLGMRHGSTNTFVIALLIALLGFISSAAWAKFLLRGEVIE